MENGMPTFGQRLRELREEVRMTQQQLADASHVNIWTIRGYEQGRREPGWKVMIALARALGKSPEAFADCSSIEDVPARDIRAGITRKRIKQSTATHRQPRKGK